MDLFSFVLQDVSIFHLFVKIKLINCKFHPQTELGHPMICFRTELLCPCLPTCSKTSPLECIGCPAFVLCSNCWSFAVGSSVTCSNSCELTCWQGICLCLSLLLGECFGKDWKNENCCETQPYFYPWCYTEDTGVTVEVGLATGVFSSILKSCHT